MSIHDVSRRGWSRRDLLTGAAAGLLMAGMPLGRARADETATPKRGGRLRVGLNAGSSKDSLDAKGALTDADMARQNQLYDTLLIFNPDYRIEPGLAETIEASDQAKTWTIRLRS